MPVGAEYTDQTRTVDGTNFVQKTDQDTFEALFYNKSQAAAFKAGKGLPE